jgi:hypothetical protein
MSPASKRAKQPPALFAKPDGGGAAMRLELSEPQPGEECCIAMEPIEEHRVEWLDAAEQQPGPLLTHPALRKATLPCGHGFHALVLLYHFAKNEMVCPCCRQGMAWARMARASIPPHLREAMEARLDRVERSEREEQLASDTLAVANLLEQEVNLSPYRRSLVLPPNRQVLILYGFADMDSLVPPLVQEIPLSSSHSSETLLFSSSGSSVRDLNRNLRLLPLNVRAFEIVIATWTRVHGMLKIVRSVRFEHGQGYVQCVNGLPGVELYPQTEDCGTHIEFFRISLRMPREMLLPSIMRSERDEMSEDHVLALIAS